MIVDRLASARSRVTVRSLSTRASGQPSETKETRGAGFFHFRHRSRMLRRNAPGNHQKTDRERSFSVRPKIGAFTPPLKA
jgi:hypothetical protein